MADALPRIVYITTNAMSLRFLAGQIGYMRERGFRVSVVASPPCEKEGTVDVYRQLIDCDGAEMISEVMSREMDPWKDCQSLARITRHLRRLSPSIVNAGTPKAGLLGMLAARIVNTPIRLYTLRGLRLETCAGVKRRILWGAERAASCCAHRVICVSHSLRDAYVAEGLTGPEKTVTLGQGASNGIDLEKYTRKMKRSPEVDRLREKLGIPLDALVIGFVGRITGDKGISELVAAFRRCEESVPKLFLLLVGDYESNDSVGNEVRRIIESHQRIVKTGFVPDSSSYYHLMDVFAFPSRREGMPNAPLEAAACEVPVVGYRVTGVRDAVVDDKTGTLVSPDMTDEFQEALLRYLSDASLRRSHGLAGRQWVREHFSQSLVWENLFQYYRTLLRERGLPLPSRRQADERELAAA